MVENLLFYENYFIFIFLVEDFTFEKIALDGQDIFAAKVSPWYLLGLLHKY